MKRPTTRTQADAGRLLPFELRRRMAAAWTMQRRAGFSLIEALVAMTITLVIGLAVFQLFRQSERAFRDQDLLLEMQQSARVAAFAIAADIRLAGQGVPVFSSTFDPSAMEDSAVILPGSTSSRINFRCGISNVESDVTSALPLQLVQGSTATLMVGHATLFSDLTGPAPTGRYAYVWGPGTGEAWNWVRTSLGSIVTSTNSIRLTPDRTVQFRLAPILSLEEAVAIYWDRTTETIRRTTALDMTSPEKPIWAPANELVAGVSALTFTYYDENRRLVRPGTLADRSAITSIAVRIAVHGSGNLTNGTRPAFSFEITVFPVNLRNR